ncbi:hypothetical protein [Pseudoxanthobacter sp.]|uniref:hypothetical protein n=1 Tax=Pseudoxanthobacter sp. TaxID=1925742 RepID=UPI002FE3307F
MSAERAFSSGSNPGPVTAGPAGKAPARMAAGRYNAAETLTYLDQMLGELAALANAADERMLGYLIAVAQEEAASRRAALAPR